MESFDVRYVELHKFADDRFVVDGYTHFVWAICEDIFVPVLHSEYGMTVSVSGEEPTIYQRYNPTTDLYIDKHPDDFVPTLYPFWDARWNNETKSWVMISIVTET